MSEQCQTNINHFAVRIERNIDLAMDDKIPWDEFVLQMKSSTKTYADSQKLITIFMNYLKNLKMKSIKKKHSKEDKIGIESVTTCKDTVLKVEQPVDTTLKIEPIEERNHDFVFENEFIKKEIVPKIEILDMDIAESKPLLDILQKPENTLDAQDGTQNQQSEVSNQHQLKKHKISFKKVSDGAITTFKCDFCGKSFHNEFQLSNHKIKIHPDFKPKIKSKNDKKCDMCKSEFPNEELMKNHIEARNSPCEFCKIMFCNDDQLNHHLTFHQNDQSFIECRIGNCEGNFFSVRNYHAHRYETHKIIQCSACGKTFEDSDELKSHLQKDHDKYKYKCNYCNRSLDTQSALKLHEKTYCEYVHKEMIGHKCEKCQKYFKTKHGLVIHNRRKPNCN